MASRVNEVGVVVEKCGNLGGARGSGSLAIAACSACAGDYEDPERSAWVADEGDDDEDERSGAMNFGPTWKQGSAAETRSGGQIGERSRNDERESKNDVENKDRR